MSRFGCENVTNMHKLSIFGNQTEGVKGLGTSPSPLLLTLIVEHQQVCIKNGFVETSVHSLLKGRTESYLGANYRFPYGRVKEQLPVLNLRATFWQPHKICV